MGNNITEKSVVIDAFNLSLEKGTGISTYARNLSYRLKEMDYNVGILYGNTISRHRQALLQEINFFDPQPLKLPQWVKNVLSVMRIIKAPLGGKAIQVPVTGAVITDTFKNIMPKYDTLWNVNGLFELAFVYFYLTNSFYKIEIPSSPKIVHWTYPLPIYASGAKNIYTLHDIVPLRLPYTTLDDKKYYLKLINKIIMNADLICTVSENSRSDLIDILNVPEKKVINTYQSVYIPEKYLNSSIDDIKSDIYGAFRLDYKDYFLFFGAIEPKKNIGRIMEGYLASGVDSPLVMAGPRAWKSDQELELLNNDQLSYLINENNETHVKKKVMHIDYVTFRLLISLIRGAKAVVFPSIYEGFGLPILESMLCGTPVITSNFGSMFEVAGDAALTVNPYDVREIRDAIRKLDKDTNMCEVLANKGLDRARNFNDKIYMEKLSEMYSLVINKPAC